uniref:WD repeat-containing protein 6-like n=1 Tax=Ciona intestinalis TaxID=7719 RepID=F7A7G3_CIOIN|nr:WD repeat-containing protein 6-like [Ciona intestinalis]|eukprot:XP_018668867.1 WD repeat-containing protein 6-like [Ciona intestinalis]
MLTSVFQKLPVTALSMNEDHIFVGQGGTVQIFKFFKENQLTLFQELQLFKNSVVHGIKCVSFSNALEVIVYGGKNVSVLTSDCSDENFKEKHKFECYDWVLDTTFIQGPQRCIAVALAHNTVLIIDLQTSAFLHEIHCKEKCILYSAHFIQYGEQLTA